MSLSQQKAILRLPPAPLHPRSRARQTRPRVQTICSDKCGDLGPPTTSPVKVLTQVTPDNLIAGRFRLGGAEDTPWHADQRIRPGRGKRVKSGRGRGQGRGFPQCISNPAFRRDEVARCTVFIPVQSSEPCSPDVLSFSAWTSPTFLDYRRLCATVVGICNRADWQEDGKTSAAVLRPRICKPLLATVTVTQGPGNKCSRWPRRNRHMEAWC
ncbi:hypothetical protein DPEC_G00137140 [Dallia pectoralis]|uniref:Uncharacterized protein n=1 Tax=Dallia pectoralis TaxID=75939 RepID=A0ACC2GLX7_DALPE|nr:hypothetical protein DPEC_G00137140 [Dallia pectoralis]